MTRRLEKFSHRQLAGAYAIALLQMAWMGIKLSTLAEKFIYGVLIGLPLLYMVIFITGG